MTLQVDRTRALLIVVAVALAVHAPSLTNMFAYDDVAVIMRDQRVHSLANLPHIFATSYWNDDSQALYRPLVNASFALDWAIASNHPGWYHFVNILWNAGASALVLLLLARLYPIAGALAGALVFAVHPVHVEAVANVVGRAELMAAVFGLGAALYWIRSRNSRDVLILAPVLLALALLSKESAIMVVPLLVLLDFATGRLRWDAISGYLRERLAGLVVIAAVVLTWIALRALVLDAFAPATLDAALEVAPRGMPRVLTALQVWPVWLRLLFVPLTLLADYGPRIIMPASRMTPLVTAGLVTVAALVGGGIAALAANRRRTALALLWLPIAALPVSNLLFPIGIIVAERTLYLPSVALAIAVAGGLTWIHARNVRFGRAASAATAAIVLAFSVRTVIRIPEWHDTGTIFRALMRDRPDAFRAHWHIARRESAAHRPAAALAAYDSALRLWPDRARLLREAGQYAFNARDLPFARRIAEHGMAVWPGDAQFPRVLALIALDAGDTAQAVTYIQRAAALAPDDSVIRRTRDELAPGVNQ